MAEDNAVVLRLDAVHKQYESADRDPVPVLKGITLTVNRGESIAIIGPSGSGKSTLLNILGSLDSPTNGSIQLDGQELAHLTEQDLASVRNKKIGFIFQSHHLLPQCSVLENVLVPTLAENGKTPAEAVERGRQLIDRVGLGHRLHQIGGQHLTQHQMCVGAAESEPGHPADRMPAVAGPVGHGVGDLEVFAVEVDVGVRPAVVDRRRDLVVAERERHLGQAGGARS